MSNEKYTITQAASITGYEPHVIRYYEKEFKLNIPRNKSNHRYFTDNEIQQLKKIKKLQQKGFSNNQIKLILNSPKTVLDIDSEISRTQTVITTDLMDSIKDEIINSLKEQLELYNKSMQELLSSIKDLINELKTEITKKDDDIILAENMKLKMKVKQKSYEVAELREKLQREKNKNVSVLNKIFGK